ncbi:MAG TPA: ATP synthase F1 subunit epsilon [Longimicrobiales bacterium]|nr:ATP synthase F1 subunit epsilon [Longimicrobiales bacterium]
MAALHVRVVSPDRVVYEGDSSSVVAPAWDGKVGILPGHAPMITLLGVGALDVDHVGAGSERFHVAGGVMKVLDDQVTVLTEYAGDQPPEIIPEGARLHEEDLIEHTFAGNPLA